MMKRLTLIAVSMLAGGCHLVGKEAPPPLTGSVTTIDGKEMDLSSYLGNAVLIVNVASRCGYTKQYKQLQELHEIFGERGLVILGFPCNQFGKQEPGTELEIKEFCQSTFGVDFPMFAKVDVNGDSAAPLYQFLTSDRVPIDDKGPIKWNFEKFVVNRNGELIARYRSAVAPDDASVVKAIERALGDGVE